MDRTLRLPKSQQQYRQDGETLVSKRKKIEESNLRKAIRDMGLKVTDQRLLILRTL